MNLVDAVVTEVISKPEFKYGKWWVTVKADSYGSVQESQLMLSTQDEALAVKPGYKFEC